MSYESWIATIENTDAFDEIEADICKYVEGLASYVWPELGDRAMTPGGRPYRTYVVGGAKAEGAAKEVHTVSLRDAVDLFCRGVRDDEFNPSLAGHPFGLNGLQPILVWRLRPEIEKHEDRFYIRARLLATYP